MYGTLRGALAARQITIDVDKYKATVEGRIEGEGRAIRGQGVSTSTRIALVDRRGL